MLVSAQERFRPGIIGFVCDAELRSLNIDTVVNSGL